MQYFSNLVSWICLDMSSVFLGRKGSQHHSIKIAVSLLQYFSNLVSWICLDSKRANICHMPTPTHPHTSPSHFVWIILSAKKESTKLVDKSLECG